MITVLTQRLLKISAVTVIKQRNRFIKNLPKPDIFYFAYGANLDPKRFQKYEMNAKPVGVAKLAGYALTFSLPCEYVGKGYASIERHEGATVWGYLYQIDRFALTLLDIMEYVFLRHYRKLTVTVTTGEGIEHNALAYVTGFPTAGLIPSTEYKSKILEAAISHNFPADYVEQIRNVPSKNTFDLDPGFSLTIPAIRRPFEKLLQRPYLVHDRIREVLCEKLRF